MPWLYSRLLSLQLCDMIAQTTVFPLPIHATTSLAGVRSITPKLHAPLAFCAYQNMQGSCIPMRNLTEASFW